MGVRLAQQVLGLVDFVAVLTVTSTAPIFGGGPEGDVPLGHVGGPDGHVVAGLDAHGDEAPGKGVHIVPEFANRCGCSPGGVPEAYAGRGTPPPCGPAPGEGQVDQRFLGPDVFAGFGLSYKAGLFGASMILAHKSWRCGEHDAGVIQLRAYSFSATPGKYSPHS